MDDENGLSMAGLSVRSPTLTVNFRGQEIEVEDGNPTLALIMALLTVEDPRVDAMLHAHRVLLRDVNGKAFWPPERMGE